MKTRTLLSVLIFTFIYGCVPAAVVSRQSAQTIALNFYKVNAPAVTGSLNAVLNYTRQDSDGTIEFYVFNIQPGPGFVIISADDNFKPVLAYSTESSFNSNVPASIGLINWMTNTGNKIHAGIQQQVSADAIIKNQWQSYANGTNPVSSRSGSVSPLVATTWNQNPYYNLFCPVISTGQCVTGCVATAMAQIMKYWDYPRQGTGSFQYDDVVATSPDVPSQYSNNIGTLSANFGATIFNWNDMPNAVTGPANDTAVAWLMYMCGISVAMNYGSESSSFVTYADAGGPGHPSAQNSYITYFAYDPNTIQNVSRANYNDADWIALLENDLNAGRVVQYVGFAPNGGGHTWVCDGYDEGNMLHMNWGWGGYYNGFYDVTDLNATLQGYNVFDEALIGIQPISSVSVSVSVAKPFICQGGSTPLTANGPQDATYSWNPPNGLECATCASTNASPDSTTTYVVTVDSAGITSKAITTITVGAQVTPQFSVVKLPGCTLPVSYAFNNTSTNATGYTWNFGDGTTGTSASPTHTYAAANTYVVTLVATNGCYTDTLAGAVQVTDDAPVVPGKNICRGQSVTLSATGSGVINWYDSPSGGNVIQTGLSYTTPPVNSNTDYYVAATFNQPPNYAGPADTSFGSGRFFTNTNTHSIIFNCSVPQVLQTVDVYASDSGNRIILLLDSAGNQLQAANIYIPAGQQTVTLNFSIPAANNLYLADSGNVALYRNSSNANYPYYSTDSTVILTGSDAGLPGYYYYFYNWVLQQPTCTTGLVPVLVDVNNLSNSISVAYSGSDNRTATFTPVNTAATSFSWNFGDASSNDNNSSTLQSPTHTYSADGRYEVVLIEGNGDCTDTLSSYVYVNVAAGIVENNLISDWTLFPNPATNVLNLNIECAHDIPACNLNIYNVLGERVFTQPINLNSGANSLDLNVTKLSPAAYIIGIENSDFINTKRFIKID